MIKQIAFSFLILILVLQLSTLRPELVQFDVRAVGSLANVSEETTTYLGKIFTEATLTSVSQEERYDSVVFTGDVMLGRHVETLLAQQSPLYVYQGFALKELSKNPAIVGNFESAAAAPHVQTPAHTLRFSVSEQNINTFGSVFTHVSLANNHSLDYGELGYTTVSSLLESSGVSVFGHNALINTESISYIETTRGRIALIGVNASQKIPDFDAVDGVCTTAKRTSDFQIVSVHWGDEYQVIHSDTQRVLAEQFVDACADVIIGHHPHVVQDVDLIKGVPVFYSLGNYIFDQYFSDDVQEGLVVVLRLEEAPVLELIPVSSKEQKSVPVPLSDLAKQTKLEKLAENSHESLTSAIRAGKINLLEPVATSTKMAIMSR